MLLGVDERVLAALDKPISAFMYCTNFILRSECKASLLPIQQALQCNAQLRSALVKSSGRPQLSAIRKAHPLAWGLQVKLHVNPNKLQAQVLLQRLITVVGDGIVAV